MTWWWWIGYAGAWAVACGAASSLVDRPGFPWPLAAGPAAFAVLLVVAAVLVAVVQRWLRESHDDRAASLARAVAELAARVGLLEAQRPGRAEPAFPLAVAWPRPAPQPYGVSHRGAEQLVADWMRHLGAFDAEVTRFTADGGVDVVSAHWIAQVKNLAERTRCPWRRCASSPASPPTTAAARCSPPRARTRRAGWPSPIGRAWACSSTTPRAGRSEPRTRTRGSW
ncbi:restriction endonuclease [Agromyces sp. C10]|uniref:restriction endonuclease n=1 Tax=Agromyces sp. C10 TaxID=2935077 RepID=UPI00200A0B28|nr:restriction endonuclease [Agromyces sp. C10]MCK8609708.1 restriction endonuclease [Agromyces sp. C10]